jgi:hypothetical protein
VGQSDNPFSLQHWLGQVDPRPLALFRIGLGLVLLEDLLLWSADFKAFLTDDGILPAAARPADWHLGLFQFVTTPAAAGALYALGILAALAFTLGFCTRIASVACWVFFVSLHTRNRELILGGDDLAGVFLFWAIFANCGACWSIDARRLPTRTTAAFGMRLLQFVPALIYLHAARFKLLLGGSGWLHGNTLYQTMQLHGWIRPPGEWLRHQPGLCAFLGDGVIIMEFAFPLLLLMPIWSTQARKLAIPLNLAVQLGIMTTMKVGIFTDLMLVSTLLYLPSSWIDAALAKLGRLRTPFTLEPAESTWAQPSPLRLALMGLLLAEFTIMAALPAAWRHIPQPLAETVRHLGLDLKVDLYSHGYAVQAWGSKALDARGQPVDAIGVVAPGLRNDSGWRFSRWTSLVGRQGIHFAELGDYLCRTYQERTGTALGSISIWSEGHDAPVPGQPSPPMWKKPLAELSCRNPARQN